MTACKAAVTRSLCGARARDFPHLHWPLAEVLLLDLAWAMARLPVTPPIGLDNAVRVLSRHLRVVTSDDLDAVAPCRAPRRTFRSPTTRARLACAAGCGLGDCNLRIGLIQHVDTRMAGRYLGDFSSQVYQSSASAALASS